MEKYYLETNRFRFNRSKQDFFGAFFIKRQIRKFNKKRHNNEYDFKLRMTLFFNEWVELQKSEPPTYTLIHYINDELDFNKKSICQAKRNDDRRRKHICEKYELFLNEFKEYLTQFPNVKLSKDLKAISSEFSGVAEEIINNPKIEQKSTRELALEFLLSSFYKSKKEHTYTINDVEFNRETRLFLLEYFLRYFSFYKEIEPIKTQILSLILNIKPTQVNKFGFNKDFYEKKRISSLEDLGDKKLTEISQHLTKSLEFVQKVSKQMQTDINDIKKIKPQPVEHPI